jgi:hypothetical protein
MKSFNQLISEIMTSTDGSVAGMHLGRPADSLPQIAGREAGRLAIRPRRNRGKKKIQKDHVEYDEVYSMVQEYFEEYFGETLNESTSDEDIMEAVYDLVALRDAVLESVGLDEALRRPPRPSWDEIATGVAKRNKNQKPESDESKQKRWDKAGLNLHNISDKSPNYVHRNNLKFDPNTGKIKEEEIDEGAKISRDPQLVIGLGKGRPAGRIEKKVKELAPEELAISPERLDDTRKNIRKYLESKKKKT